MNKYYSHNILLTAAVTLLFQSNPFYEKAICNPHIHLCFYGNVQ